MPYINNEDRKKWAEVQVPKNAGELNFLFTKIAIMYMKDQNTSYQRINDVLGALEGCKLEFNRRLVANYENYKIAANGDVYED